jgi:hypothetical protein
MNKVKMYALLREPSTYAGIAGVIISAFALEGFSVEQATGIVGSLVAMFLPEAKV